MLKQQKNPDFMTWEEIKDFKIWRYHFILSHKQNEIINEEIFEDTKKSFDIFEKNWV